MATLIELCYNKLYFTLNKNDVPFLHLPLHLKQNLLKPKCVKLPPGWYYAPKYQRFVVDEDKMNKNIQRNICRKWKQENIKEFHRHINFYVEFNVFEELPLLDDDFEYIYMNTDLIQARLFNILCLGNKRLIKPWSASVLLYEHHSHMTQLYSYVSVDAFGFDKSLVICNEDDVLEPIYYKSLPTYNTDFPLISQ